MTDISRRIRNTILPGFVFFCASISAAQTVPAETDASGAEKKAAEPLPAQEAPSRPTYSDKKSGDDAYQADDFSVAASFYRKYRMTAEAAHDREALRDAFEREIDALIRGGLPAEAEQTLSAYERSFIGVNSLSLALWRANILLLQKRPSEAEKLLMRVLPGLPANDPRRVNATSSLAFLRELQKRYGDAAELYSELAGLEGDQTLSRRSLERCILMLVAAGRLDDALQKLKSMPLANKTKRDLLALRFLSFYLQQKKNPDGMEEQWKELGKERPEKKEYFFYLVSTLIAETFEAADKQKPALEAFRLAFDCAPSADEERDTLSRMIDLLERTGDAKQAAELALSQFEIFRGSSTTPAVRLRTGELLSAAGNFDKALMVYESVFNGKTPEKDADSAFRSALDDLLKHKAFSHAEKLIMSFYKGAPDGADACMALAKTAKAAGDFSKAADLYCQAAQKEPALRDNAMMRAIMVWTEQKNDGEVIRLCSDLLRTHASSPALICRAVSYENTGKEEAALADYEAFLKIQDPSIPPEQKAQALYRIGRILLKKGDIKKSAEYFSEVFRRYQKTAFAPAAGYYLVYAHILQGNDLDAERETWHLTEQFPGSEYRYSAQLLLASHYGISAGTADRAVAALNAAAEQTTHPALRLRALYQKALLYYREEKYSEAEETLQELEALSPDDPNLSEALYLRGDIQRGQGLFKQAVPYYLEAAKRRPASLLEQAAFGAAGDCVFALAAKADDKAMYADALAYYRKITENPSARREYLAMATFKAARCLQAAGNTEEAYAEYRKLLYLMPAEQAAKHPAETFWIVKGAEALIRLAEADAAGTRADTANAALNWLVKAGILDPASAKTRIRSIRRKKYRPLRQEIHRQ